MGKKNKFVFSDIFFQLALFIFERVCFIFIFFFILLSVTLRFLLTQMSPGLLNLLTVIMTITTMRMRMMMMMMR